MNKFKYYFILLLASVAIVSCNKKDDDDVVVTPPRDYAVQYKADNDSIEKYLKTNYIKSVSPEFDIVIEKIPTGGAQVSIWDQKTYPLEFRNVYNRDVTYKVYYITLNKGTGSAPCNTDRIYGSYAGSLLNGTVFDTSYGLGRTFDLYGGVITGWSEIFPKFKTGKVNPSSGNGTITYSDYGAGVMFLPSGLAYYNAPTTSAIPDYAPLVFSFKLFDLERLDHEYTISQTTGSRIYVGDGIPDYLEDINGDGYLYDLRDKTTYPNPPADMADDTDGDGLADFLDHDDDGDGYTTRFEISKPTTEIGIVNGINFGASLYYPYNAPILDNPATPNVDETEPRGIPAFAATGEPDYTTPTRLRIHVDKNHHSAKP